MNIAIFTGNAIRHKYLANTICEDIDENCLVVSESVPLIGGGSDDKAQPLLIQEHFSLRDRIEAVFFSGNDTFRVPTLPLSRGEINLPYPYRVIKNFKPDLIIVFGSSIIKEPLLSILPYGRMINLHLGLSPYYRGSGTNFWPFVNDELEYVGSTILCIDRGVDTGDIIAHVMPKIEIGDTVHTLGCKVIKESTRMIALIISATWAAIESGRQLKTVKQWLPATKRYYRKADFTEEALKKYYENLRNGIAERFVSNPRVPPTVVNLEF